MQYQVITDEQKLVDFINWLPELQPNEKYYLCLFSRSKYSPDSGIKADKCQLKRFTADKARLLSKIKQLQVEVGAYTQGDISIPQESLALYITVNPRDMFKASINTMVKLAQSIRDNNVGMNPHSEALSEIQKAKSRTCYIDFDIDETDPDKLEKTVLCVKSYMNEEAITWLKTRGGLHVLVDPSKVKSEYKKTFFRNMTSLPNLDQHGDQLIPVPGTFQGGYTPTFVCY